MVEYGFLVLLIALVVIGAAALIGENLSLLFFTRAANCILNGPPC